LSCVPTQVLGYEVALVPCVRGTQRGGAVRRQEGNSRAGRSWCPQMCSRGWRRSGVRARTWWSGPHVLVLAKRMGYRRTVRWVEENPEEYARGISRGFETMPGKEEG
jgi:hypothetical protein